MDNGNKGLKPREVVHWSSHGGLNPSNWDEIWGAQGTEKKTPLELKILDVIVWEWVNGVMSAVMSY